MKIKEIFFILIVGLCMSQVLMRPSNESDESNDTMVSNKDKKEASLEEADDSDEVSLEFTR
jgi:hypothetical protein